MSNIKGGDSANTVWRNKKMMTKHQKIMRIMREQNRLTAFEYKDCKKFYKKQKQYFLQARIRTVFSKEEYRFCITCNYVIGAKGTDVIWPYKYCLSCLPAPASVFAKELNITRWYNYHRLKLANCELCGFKEIVDLHHIVPKMYGGEDNPENLITLCPNCHAAIHRKGLWGHPRLEELIGMLGGNKKMEEYIRLRELRGNLNGR